MARHYPARRPECWVEYRWAWGPLTPARFDKLTPPAVPWRLLRALSYLTRHTYCFYDDRHDCDI